MSVHRKRRCCAFALVFGFAAVAGAPQVLAQPEIFGEWDDADPVEAEWIDGSIHATHLPTGKLIVWERCGDTVQLWDVADEVLEDAFLFEQPCTFNNDYLYCSGHAPLPGGSLLVGGGRSVILAALSYEFQLSGNWVDRPDMKEFRFYPTLISLAPSGKILALGGDCENPPCNNVEIYDQTVTGWSLLEPTPGQDLQEYPWAFELPDGRVAVVGGHDETPQANVTKFLDLSELTWDPNGPVASWTGTFGSAVMYEPGMVLRAGGLDVATPSNKTALIDFAQPVPEWSELIVGMENPRVDFNLVLLPDGHVLAVGGQDDLSEDVLEAEWIDPTVPFPMWIELAPMDHPRASHSTAVLLPNGKVFVGGDTHGTTPRPEIFSPPYLFYASPTPTISFAPSAVAWGQSFLIVLGSSAVPAQNIDKVHLIRLGSVTHGFDQNQRLVPLDFTVAGNSRIRATIPNNSHDAPPGYYMLFVVSDAGVPSWGVYIYLIPITSGTG